MEREVSAFQHLLKANSLKTWKTPHLNQCYPQNVNVNVLIWGTAILILIPSMWWEVSWCISGSGKSILAKIPKAREEILQNKAEGFWQGPGYEGLSTTLKMLVFILEQWKTSKSSTKWNTMSKVAVWKGLSYCSVESYLEQETSVLFSIMFRKNRTSKKMAAGTKNFCFSC